VHCTREIVARIAAATHRRARLANNMFVGEFALDSRYLVRFETQRLKGEWCRKLNSNFVLPPLKIRAMGEIYE